MKREFMTYADMQKAYFRNLSVDSLKILKRSNPAAWPKHGRGFRFNVRRVMDFIVANVSPSNSAYYVAKKYIENDDAILGADGEEKQRRVKPAVSADEQPKTAVDLPEMPQKQPANVKKSRLCEENLRKSEENLRKSEENLRKSEENLRIFEETAVPHAAHAEITRRSILPDVDIDDMKGSMRELRDSMADVSSKFTDAIDDGNGIEANMMLGLWIKAFDAMRKALEGLLDMEKRRIGIERLKGELVRKDETAQEYGVILTQVRNKLMTLPAKLANELVGVRKASVVQDTLDTEIRDALMGVQKWLREYASSESESESESENGAHAHAHACTTVKTGATEVD